MLGTPSSASTISRAPTSSATTWRLRTLTSLNRRGRTCSEERESSSSTTGSSCERDGRRMTRIRSRGDWELLRRCAFSSGIISAPVPLVSVSSTQTVDARFLFAASFAMPTL